MASNNQRKQPEKYQIMAWISDGVSEMAESNQRNEESEEEASGIEAAKNVIISRPKWRKIWRSIKMAARRHKYYRKKNQKKNWRKRWREKNQRRNNGENMALYRKANENHQWHDMAKNINIEISINIENINGSWNRHENGGIKNI